MDVSGHTYSLLDEGSVVKRRMIRLVIFLLTFIILVVIIVPTYMAYSNSQGIHDNEYQYYLITPPDTIGSSPGNFTDGDDNRLTTAEATFTFTLCNIESVKKTANICVVFIDPLDAAMASVFDIPNLNDTSFHFNDEVKTINASRYTAEWIFPILLFGDTVRYPFDYYLGQFSFQFFANRALIDGITTTVYGYGAPSGWEVFYNITGYEDGLFVIQPMINRNIGTKGFSLFIVILLWVLSLCQFFIAAQSLIRNRQIVELLLALPATLLFALPGLRNVQPDVPPIGIILDMAGFFWNMALVAISLITLCIMLIHQYKVAKNQHEQSK